MTALAGLLGPGLQGFGLGGSLIVAIGAQNAFVLRQGLKRQYVFTLATLCFVSDAALIALGCGGFGSVVQAHPQWLRAVTWIGAAFLFAYALRSAWAALRAQALDPSQAPAVESSYRRIVLSGLAVTWFNPHVYLDTVVLLGGIAGRYAGAHRLAFAVGAATASCLWFYGLGFGAAKLAPLFARPATWRVLDGLIALTMAALAFSLLRSAGAAG